MKAGLLSVAMVVGTQMAGMPAIPEMVEHYAWLSRELVEGLVTVQSLSAMCMVLVLPWMAGRFGEKRTVTLGLATAAVAGVVPVVTDAYPVVLGSRIAFGLGIGMVSPLAISMIAGRFQGRERDAMLGARSAAETFGMAVSSPIAAALLSFGWQASYLVYLVLAVPLALFCWAVPEEAPVDRASRSVRTPVRFALNAPVLAVVALNLSMTLVYASFELRISSIVAVEGLGSPMLSGVLASVLAVSASFFGLLYGGICARLGNATGAFGLMLMGVGIFLGSTTSSLALFVLGVIMAGAAFPLAMSYLSGIISLVCPPGAEDFCTSLFVAGGFVGSFVCPWVLACISEVAGNASITLPLAIIASMLFVLGVVVYLARGCFCARVARP